MSSITSSLRRIFDISLEILGTFEKTSLSPFESLSIWLRLLLLKQWSDNHRQKETEIQPEKTVREAQWWLIESCGQNYAEVINGQLQQIETNNEIIPPVLSNSPEFRWDKYSDTLLKPVIERISQLDLTKHNTENGKGLGKVIEKIFDEKAKTHQDIANVWIPQSLVQLLRGILPIDDKSSIYDPRCGLGRFFAEYLRDCPGEPEKIDKNALKGQESSVMVYQLARLYLGLQKFWSVKLEPTDAIEKPLVESQEKRTNQLQKFDVILSVLPMSNKLWGYKFAQYDPYERFSYGLPRTEEGDWAYIQHILACLKSTGKAVVIVSPSALSRTKETKIRKEIIEGGYLEQVIELPENLLYNTRLSTCLLILRPKQKPSPVMFIDGSQLGQKYKTMNILKPEAVKRLIELSSCSEEDKDKSCRLVSLENLRETDYNLTPSCYFFKEVKKSTFEDEYQNFKTWEKKRHQAIEKADSSLKALGIKIQED